MRNDRFNSLKFGVHIACFIKLFLLLVLLNYFVIYYLFAIYLPQTGGEVVKKLKMCFSTSTGRHNFPSLDIFRYQIKFSQWPIGKRIKFAIYHCANENYEAKKKLPKNRISRKKNNSQLPTRYIYKLYIFRVSTWFRFTIFWYIASNQYLNIMLTMF